MGENRPTVSVIIPTYNRAELVGRAIQSVLDQTYQDFEIIIVSDGSTDNTDEVVNRYKDTRIVYLRHNKNRGGSAARNTGINIAKGQYIGLLDSDDEWLPQKLEKQVDKLQMLPNKVGVVYSGFYYVSEKNGQNLSKVVPTLRGNVYDNLLQGCILGGPTPLVRKLCFEKAGFFEEALPSCQDWDMWIRLSKYYEFDFVPDFLAKHYVHGDQISTDLRAKIKAREWIVKKYQTDLLKNPSILSRHLKRLGVLYCLDCNSPVGRNYFLQSLKHNPRQKGSYIHFVLSLLAPGVHRNILRRRNVINIDGVKFYY